ncbi:MAG: radical SAM protein [Candidatus Omnitrophota bacterium]|jgi:radical SAM protein with 4Fe4S-binding SPASM domain
MNGINMAKKMSFVSMIIVNHNGKRFLKNCFDSLLTLDYPKDRFEIIMVDNCSQDGSPAFVKKYYPKVKIIANDINNYCRANNLGMKKAKGEFIAFLNNDIIVDKKWLTELIQFIIKDKSIGGIGGKVLFTDGKIQSAGHQEYPNFYWGDRGFREKDNGQYDYITEVPSLCGVAVIYRKSCLNDIGFLDEDFNMYLEDVDMGIRCGKKSWKLLFYPKSVVYHKFHGTIGIEEKARFWQEKNRLLLIAKHWPDKLPEAISGREYFKERDICDFVSGAYTKLIDAHGIETARKISPMIFEELRKIFNYEGGILALDNKISLSEVKQQNIEKNKIISFLKRELQRKDKWLEQLKDLDIEKNQLLEDSKQQFQRELQRKDKWLEQLKDLDIEKNQLLEDAKQQLKTKDEYLGQLKQQDVEKNNALTEASQQIKAQHETIECLKQENNGKNEIINQLQKENQLLQQNFNHISGELKGVYGSTGFRLILKPLWTILWQIKQPLKKLRPRLLSGLQVLNTSIPKIAARIRQDIDIVIANKWSQGYLRHIYRKSLAPTPRKLILKLTSKCNLDCRFCDIARQNHGKKELSKEEVFRIIDSASRLGVEELEITGGEPLLHPDLWEIVEYAYANNIGSNVTTNGLLIKDQIDKIIKSPVWNICISVDGKQETHDKLRNRQGAYQALIEALDLLKNHKKHVVVGFVVTNENVHELEEVYNYFTGKNIDFDFWPVNNQPGLYFKNERQNKLFVNFANKLKRIGKISPARHRYYLKTLDYFTDNLPKRRCLGLIDHFAIDTEGEILPCCVWGAKHLNLGNALGGNLETIWYSEEFRKARKALLEQGCSECYNTALCRFQEVTKKPFLINGKKESLNKVEKPSRVLLNVTIKCNLSCLHCDNWKMKPQKELTFKQIKKIIDELSRWLDEGFELIIGGGEPFIRKGIIDIIKYCKSKKIRTSVPTNGTLLNKELCDEILESGISNLIFSLDGINARTHDFSRGKKGVFDKIMAALTYINKHRNNRFPLNIATILMQTNLDEILDLVNLRQREGLTGIYFLPLSQNFNASYNPDWYKNSPLWPKDSNKLNEVIDRLIQLKRENFSLVENTVEQLTLFKKYYHNPNSEFHEQCTVGRRMFSITEDGHILLCPMRGPIGHIKKDRFDKIWHSVKAQEERRKNDLCTKSCKILGCYNNE